MASCRAIRVIYVDRLYLKSEHKTKRNEKKKERKQGRKGGRKGRREGEDIKAMVVQERLAG